MPYNRFNPYQLVIAWKQYRLGKALQQQFPAILSGLISALQAGLTLPQAFQLLSIRFREPTRPLFVQIVRQYQAGMPLPTALQLLSTSRLDEEVSLLRTAIEATEAAGGDLVRSLRRVRDLNNSKRKLMQKTQTLSAQGKGQAITCALLPFALLFVLQMVDATYLEPLYSTAIGQALSAYAVTSIVVGSLWVCRISRVRL